MAPDVRRTIQRLGIGGGRTHGRHVLLQLLLEAWYKVVYAGSHMIS